MSNYCGTGLDKIRMLAVPVCAVLLVSARAACKHKRWKIGMPNWN